MDKIIWMIWYQGLDHHSFDEIHRVCLNEWKRLNVNSDWKIVVLTNNNISKYAPEYFDIISKCKYNRNLQSQSDLLRLLLLKKHGGVYVDCGVYPFLSAEQFVDKIDNGSDIFMFKWTERQYNDTWGDRDISSSFIWSKHQNNQVIDLWLERYMQVFLNLDPWRYYTVHHVLTELYDTESAVKHTLDNMVQVDGETIGSTRESWYDYKPGGFMYKRGKIKHPAVKPPWEPPLQIRKLWT